MHELSVATELYRALRAEVQARGGGRLLAARILVGELAAIEPRLLAYAWEAVVAAGPDEGAELEIEARRATCTCPTCGVVDAPPGDGWLRRCPTCAAPVVLVGGQELDVVSLTFDDAPASAPAEPGDEAPPSTSSRRNPEPMEIRR